MKSKSTYVCFAKEEEEEEGTRLLRNIMYPRGSTTPTIMIAAPIKYLIGAGASISINLRICKNYNEMDQQLDLNETLTLTLDRNEGRGAVKLPAWCLEDADRESDWVWDRLEEKEGIEGRLELGWLLR